MRDMHDAGGPPPIYARHTQHSLIKIKNAAAARCGLLSIGMARCT
jgi:hypothetical protein